MLRGRIQHSLEFRPIIPREEERMKWKKHKLRTKSKKYVELFHCYVSSYSLLFQTIRRRIGFVEADREIERMKRRMGVEVFERGRAERSRRWEEGRRIAELEEKMAKSEDVLEVLDAFYRRWGPTRSGSFY